MILIGKFLQTHGLKGGIKLLSYCDEPMDIFNYNLFLSNGEKIDCKKIANTSKNDAFVVNIGEIGRIEDVENFVNKEIFIEEKELDELTNDNSFYINNLLEMKAISGDKCGIVKNIYNYGAGDNIEILWEDGKIEAVPFTEQYVKNVDEEARTIYINEIMYI